MDGSVSKVIAIIALLISVSATYNAYLLRGGKLAWSQVLIVLGMISFMLSFVFEIFLPGQKFLGNVNLAEVLFVLGFVFLLAASVKLRFALR